MLDEIQIGSESHVVSSRWAGDENRLAIIYPSSRKVELTYDKLDRIGTIRQTGSFVTPFVAYAYIGPARVLERVYRNIGQAGGIDVLVGRLTYLDDSRGGIVGYDGLKRIVLHRHFDANSELIVGFSSVYDRVNNKLSEARLHDGGLEKYEFG